ncbi:MAG: hypothetical protein EOO01_37365 [Chitinophagaceae bacterium]|nr:MAG: hypothetical protein EOO01_37365 [Chitinophagaceae bacterium]
MKGLEYKNNTDRHACTDPTCPGNQAYCFSAKQKAPGGQAKLLRQAEGGNSSCFKRRITFRPG